MSESFHRVLAVHVRALLFSVEFRATMFVQYLYDWMNRLHGECDSQEWFGKLFTKDSLVGSRVANANTRLSYRGLFFLPLKGWKNTIRDQQMRWHLDM